MVALPPQFDKITVFDDYVDLLGTPAGGRVTFQPDNLLYTLIDGPTILPVAIEAPLDADGHFEVELPVTNDPDIIGINTYTVVFALTGGTGTTRRVLRAQPPTRLLSLDINLPNRVRLSTLLPSSDPTLNDFESTEFEPADFA